MLPSNGKQPAPVKPSSPARPLPTNPQQKKSLFTRRSEAKKEDIEYLDVPEDDICLPAWRMLVNKVKPGDDLKIRVTIRNLGTKVINEKFSMRVVADAYFQSNSIVVNKSIGASGETEVDFTLKVNAGNDNLNNLPPVKEILLLKETGGKLGKVGSISIIIPIDIFIRYIKEEFAPMRALLWGLFGTGKSSYINSVATMFNEDVKLANRKVSPAFVKPSGGTVTTELHSYTFNNVTLQDSWGWESGRKEVYSPMVFQLMMAGLLGKEFKMEKAADISVLNLPTDAKKNPVDIVLFFITWNAVGNSDYLDKMNEFIKEARNLKIPFLVLLTQIDKFDPTLRADPYATNEAVDELLGQVCAKIEMDESWVCPVVNYTREKERVWAMDRAAFVTLYKAFQAREEARM